MTTKDYEIIARVMRVYEGEMNSMTHSALVNGFAVALAQDNPRFDAVKFRETCRK